MNRVAILIHINNYTLSPDYNISCVLSNMRTFHVSILYDQIPPRLHYHTPYDHNTSQYHRGRVIAALPRVFIHNTVEIIGALGAAAGVGCRVEALVAETLLEGHTHFLL